MGYSISKGQLPPNSASMTLTSVNPGAVSSKDLKQKQYHQNLAIENKENNAVVITPSQQKSHSGVAGGVYQDEMNVDHSNKNYNSGENISASGVQALNGHSQYQNTDKSINENNIGMISSANTSQCSDGFIQ